MQMYIFVRYALLLNMHDIHEITSSIIKIIIIIILKTSDIIK